MKATARKKCIYACMLVAAAAVSFVQGAAAQAATCPSLTADDIGSPQMKQTLWEGVIKACSEYTAGAFAATLAVWCPLRAVLCRHAAH
jgi:hypothetical protein